MGLRDVVEYPHRDMEAGPLPKAGQVPRAPSNEVNGVIGHRNVITFCFNHDIEHEKVLIKRDSINIIPSLHLDVSEIKRIGTYRL